MITRWNNTHPTDHALSRKANLTRPGNHVTIIIDDSSDINIIISARCSVAAHQVAIAHYAFAQFFVTFFPSCHTYIKRNKLEHGSNIKTADCARWGDPWVQSTNQVSSVQDGGIPASWHLQRWRFKMGGSLRNVSTGGGAETEGRISLRLYPQLHASSGEDLQRGPG